MDGRDMIRKKGHNLYRKGFTLAEVLIVVACVAILAGVGIPLLSKYFKNQQLKRVEDQKLAAKVAAVTAFYTGYDSQNKPVDITENGICTFLYDESNDSVYVLNSNATVEDFYNAGYRINRYGLRIDSSDNYSNKVILVTFDGRYFNYQPYFSSPNNSKGTFEEPILIIKWRDVTNTSFFK